VLHSARITAESGLSQLRGAVGAAEPADRASPG